MRPWLSWIERLATDQKVGGSNPSGRANSENPVDDNRRDFRFFVVTHTFELAFDSDRFVSLVATVVEDGSFRRTYRIIRKSADGIAYANSIVSKYKLDYSHIFGRIRAR